VTDNAAYTWQAAVQETVDATLNRTVSSGISGASYYEGVFSQVRSLRGVGKLEKLGSEWVRLVPLLVCAVLQDSAVHFDRLWQGLVPSGDCCHGSVGKLSLGGCSQGRGWGACNV
jgi:hypothetical protein